MRIYYVFTILVVAKSRINFFFEIIIEDSSPIVGHLTNLFVS